MSQGEFARNEAMGRADAAADPQWKVDALLAIETLAKVKPTFTADDVWNTGLAVPIEPRAIGPVLANAQRKKMIRNTGTFEQSQRRHLDNIPVWESLIHPNYSPTLSKKYTALTFSQDDLVEYAAHAGKVMKTKDYESFAVAIGDYLLKGAKLEDAIQLGSFGLGKTA